MSNHCLFLAAWWLPAQRKPGRVGNFAPAIRSTSVATIVITNGGSPQVIWALSSPYFKKIPLRRAPKSKL
jgi:hypothetical protein